MHQMERKGNECKGRQGEKKRGIRSGGKWRMGTVYVHFNSSLRQRDRSWGQGYKLVEKDVKMEGNLSLIPSKTYSDFWHYDLLASRSIFVLNHPHPKLAWEAWNHMAGSMFEEENQTPSRLIRVIKTDDYIHELRVIIISITIWPLPSSSLFIIINWINITTTPILSASASS